MHTHTLHPDTHAAFLAEQRKDPITGDVLKAGDTVVCCAECGSAFLVDSWEYMGKSHCGQRRTLESVPESETLTLKRELEEGALYYFEEFAVMTLSAEKVFYNPIHREVLKFANPNTAYGTLLSLCTAVFLGVLVSSELLYLAIFAGLASALPILLILLFVLPIEKNFLSREERSEYKSAKYHPTIEVFENVIKVHCKGYCYFFWKNNLEKIEFIFESSKTSSSTKKLTFKAYKKGLPPFSATCSTLGYEDFLKVLKPWQKNGILQVKRGN